MRIRDTITFQNRPPFPGLSATDPNQIREAYVLTQEAGEICARILNRLASCPNPQPGALLFTGNRGVGKTHLLQYLAALMRDPNSSAWADLQPYLRNGDRPKAPLSSLFIQVPEDPEIRLERFLSENFGEILTSLRSGVPDGFASRLKQAMIHLSEHGLGFIVLEDLSGRIDRTRDPQQLQRDIRLYRRLAETLSKQGILVILVAEDRHLTPDDGRLLSGLRSCCDFLWLSRNNIAQIIDRTVVLKTDEQKARIRDILARLRQKLSTFGPSAETFVELYPVHPHLFNALFQLRALVPQFSPLNFIQTAIASSLDQPAERLVSLDCLFDYILPELRQNNLPMLTYYDEFRSGIIPRMKNDRVRQKAEALLKAIALSTICENLPSSVQSLANSLLLYDESDFLPGYSLSRAFLMEMEQMGGSSLLAQGENLDRHYRLPNDVKPVYRKPSREFLERENASCLQFLIYDWVRANIPGWTPDSSPKHRRSSQSLVAPLPGNDSQVPGLVYFKGVQDPVWTEEDLHRLLESNYSWIVLMLSPTEHFHEVDPALRALASQSVKVIIWRPDAPSPYELERLRESSLGANRASGASKSGRSKTTKEQARKILTELYVKRGRLITAADEWSIADDIDGFTLTQYLSRRLGRIASLEGNDPAAAAAVVPETIGIDPVEAFRWASAIAGADLSGTDPEQAAEKVLSRWADIQSTEPSLPGLYALPESFRTVRVWSEIRSFLGDLDVLKPIMQALGKREISFAQAMARMSEHFGDLNRAVAWQESLKEVAVAIQWAPEFDRVRAYVSLAFPTGQKPLDEMRAKLLDSIDHPHRLMGETERKTFERMFEEFKGGYIDLYCSRHEHTLHIASNTAKNKPKLDSTALHNLEMLSNLHYTDKSYLNRVKIIGKLVRQSQCELPVREILDRYPRCYCNFNPGANTQASALVAQIDGAIREGIDYFRNLLRKCSLTIIEELKNLNVDDHHARQIASLISREPMMLLKPRAIDILNQVIQKHATEFITGSDQNRSFGTKL